MECNVCKNYNMELDECECCCFELDSTKLSMGFDLFTDILEVDDAPSLLTEYLNKHNVSCLYSDVWGDTNIAFIIGCYTDKYTICKVLGLHEDVVSVDSFHGWVILNLFQEKYLRGLL